MKKIIFIIGTGRSGTHLIGRTVASHPDIEGHIENPNHFMLSAYIAAYQDILPNFITQQLKRNLVKRYNALLSASHHNFILDKSHANIWLAEYLTNAMPNALFVGVLRDPLPTVSSMMQHKDVMSWYKKIPQRWPNRFLGITKDNVACFRKLSLEQKCVLRWQSHKRELIRLQNVIPAKRLMLINYEEFLIDPGPHLDKLANFIEIENRYQYESLQLESLDKWQNGLSPLQLENIQALISTE
jgi:hypothetical protein